ncbi:MAG: HEPN domain-containing protein [Rhodospirillales bacterium]
MSIAANVFALSIQDAENLLKHFDALNTHPPPPEIEVLKRAGLILAMTAWETYVEDRVQEAAETRVAGLPDAPIATFFKAKLAEETRRLHNPNSEKTAQLFHDYAGVDVTKKWAWNQHEPTLVRDRLDQYMKLRGDIVHRSRALGDGKPMPHAVKREDLERAINFLKRLVAATEAAFPE